MKSLYLDNIIRPKNRSNPLYQKYLAAVESLFASERANSLRAGILYGSLSRNAISENSDIDVLLICPDEKTDGECFKEIRYNDVRFDSWEISEKSLLNILDGEPNRVSRPIAGILSHSTHVFGDPHISDGLMKKAQTVLAAPVKPVPHHEAKNLYNFIESRIPFEFEKTKQKTKVGYLSEVGATLSRFFDAIHQLNQSVIPQTKQMDDSLSHIKDREIALSFSETIREENLELKSKKFYDLSHLLAQRLKAHLVDSKSP